MIVCPLGFHEDRKRQGYFSFVFSVCIIHILRLRSLALLAACLWELVPRHPGTGWIEWATTLAEEPLRISTRDGLVDICIQEPTLASELLRNLGPSFEGRISSRLSHSPNLASLSQATELQRELEAAHAELGDVKEKLSAAEVRELEAKEQLSAAEVRELGAKEQLSAAEARELEAKEQASTMSVKSDEVSRKLKRTESEVSHMSGQAWYA